MSGEEESIVYRNFQMLLGMGPPSAHAPIRFAGSAHSLGFKQAQRKPSPQRIAISTDIPFQVTHPPKKWQDGPFTTPIVQSDSNAEAKQEEHKVDPPPARKLPQQKRTNVLASRSAFAKKETQIIESVDPKDQDKKKPESGVKQSNAFKLQKVVQKAKNIVEKKAHPEKKVQPVKSHRESKSSMIAQPSKQSVGSNVKQSSAIKQKQQKAGPDSKGQQGIPQQRAIELHASVKRQTEFSTPVNEGRRSGQRSDTKDQTAVKSLVDLSDPKSANRSSRLIEDEDIGYVNNYEDKIVKPKTKSIKFIRRPDIPNLQKEEAAVQQEEQVKPRPRVQTKSLRLKNVKLEIERRQRSASKRRFIPAKGSAEMTRAKDPYYRKYGAAQFNRTHIKVNCAFNMRQTQRPASITPSRPALGYSLRWVPASQFYQRHPYLVVNNPLQTVPSAIGRDLGGLLSVLLARESAVRALLEDQLEHGQGLYFLRLCVKGVWRYFQLDDALPVDDQGHCPLTHYPNSHPSPSLLPTLLEKALLLAFGSPQSLRSASLCVLLQTVFGSPTTVLPTSSQFLSRQLSTAILKGYLVLASEGDSLTEVRLQNWQFLVQKGEDTSSLGLAQFKRHFEQAFVVSTHSDYFRLAHRVACHPARLLWLKVPERSHCYIEAFALQKYSRVALTLLESRGEESPTLLAGGEAAEYLVLQVGMQLGRYQLLVESEGSVQVSILSQRQLEAKESRTLRHS